MSWLSAAIPAAALGVGAIFGGSNFLLGDDTASKRQNAMWDRLANIDNRQADFNRFAGSALNNLGARGVINSSVGSSALANAAAQAEQNYLNHQMGLANLAFQQQDRPGALHGILGGLTQGFGQGLGTKFGGLFGEE